MYIELSNIREKTFEIVTKRNNSCLFVCLSVYLEKIFVAVNVRVLRFF